MIRAFGICKMDWKVKRTKTETTENLCGSNRAMMEI